MATLQVKMPVDFTIKLDKLGAMTDAVVGQALEAGGQIALGIMKGNLQGVLGNTTRGTGELMGSLGVTPVKQDNSGNSNVKVGFNEPRRHQNAARGKRSYKARTNAMIANVLEHGKHNQPARPFLAPAKSAARAPCIAAMKAEMEAVIDSL